MVLAVYMPEQEPQPGQAFSVRFSSSSSVMAPLRTAPTPSKTLMRSVLLRPASMGPPLMMIEGRFRRIMAMSMPGTILSQLGMKTSASKGWAVAMISMESVMTSREVREKRIPS